MCKIINKDSYYPGFCTATSMLQLGHGIWANLSTVAIGLAFGFPAIQTPQLTVSSDFKVTTEEVSWLASILTLFSSFGCILSGILMDRYGRSVMVQCCTLPMFAGWIYTVLSQTALHMMIARALLGFGCGMAMGPSRIFTSETSLPNIRGLLGAFPNMFMSFGMAVQAALSLSYSWTDLCYISGVFNLVLFGSYIFLTETPHFLLLRDNTGKARNALSKVRAKGYDIEKEINDLIDFKQENNIRSLNCCEKLKAMKTRHACKPFGIILIYITCESLVGTPFVTFWTIELLLALKSSFDVYTGNFSIAFTRFIFCGVASAFLFRTPRKTMALISAGGVGVTCFSLAIFINFEKEPSIYPQIFLMIYTAFASLGFYILPFLFMSELYPLQIRGTLTGISISIISVQKFLIAKCFPSLRDSLGISNIMILNGASAFFCFIFLYIFLPETKGLTLREIEERYNDHSSSPDRGQHSSLHATFPTSLGRRRLADVVRKKKHEKEFLQTYDSTSIISRESKKSVTLLIGDKQFKSMTSIEKEEMKNIQNSEENNPNSIKTEGDTNKIEIDTAISPDLFDKTKKDENESHTENGTPSTSKKAKDSNKNRDVND